MKTGEKTRKNLSLRMLLTAMKMIPPIPAPIMINLIHKTITPRPS